MVESKAQRAARLYRDAADAMEAIPYAFRRQTLMGPRVSPGTLRDEAAHVEALLAAMEMATEDGADG